jgi:hypothetical protein
MTPIPGCETSTEHEKKARGQHTPHGVDVDQILCGNIPLRRVSEGQVLLIRSHKFAASICGRVSHTAQVTRAVEVKYAQRLNQTVATWRFG